MEAGAKKFSLSLKSSLSRRDICILAGWRKPPEYRRIMETSRRDSGRRTMSSTHLSLNYHIVFSTKDRTPCISPRWRGDLHAYLGGVLKQMEAVPLAINGVADHVHLLVAFRSTHCLADVMRELKTVSSKWVREKHLIAFTWQEGYGAFTVSASLREKVRTYIEDQEEHHRTRTFAEELVALLEKAGVAYDPRYL